MRMGLSMFRTALISMFLTSAALADTWTVDDDGPADFQSISAAVSAASDGDEIIVAPGTYTSSSYAVVLVSGKSLWIHSSDGYAATIIDGEDKSMCMWLDNSNSTIEGFTLKRGLHHIVGGMYVYGSDATITNCLFSDNHAEATSAANTAGALSTSGLSNVILSGCHFYDNTSHQTGGIYISGDSSITNCVISGNTGGSYAGGITVLSGDISISNCTIEYNEGGDVSGGGGGLWIYAGGVHVLADGVWHFLDSSNVTIFDCNVWWNTCPNGVDKQILVTDGGGLQMYGDNVVDNTYAENSGSIVAFQAGSICTMAGPYSQTSQITTVLDVDDLNAEALLKVTGTMEKNGCLTITNESNSLANSQVGDRIKLFEFGQTQGGGGSVVLPVMPLGLGLEFISGPINGGEATRVELEVVEVEQAEFTDPISAALSGEVVDIISFDADGDGDDEMAILYEGSPGAVAVYEVSEDGSPPTEITDFTAFVGNNPVDIDKEDLNGDGLEDLVVANATDDASITILITSESDGTLSFSTSTISYGGKSQSLSCVAIIDWDGDDDLDVVVGVNLVNEELEDKYKVMLDIATSPASGPSLDIPMYQPGVGAAFADPPTCVDDTGGLGFVGGTRYGRVHRAIQGGSLQTIGELSGNNVATIKVIELDADGGDGQIDLMVASDEAETIYLFQGNASEADGFENLIPLGVALPAEDLIGMDADDDGDVDIVMTAPESDTPLVLLRNDGTGDAGIRSLTNNSWSKQEMNSGAPPAKVVSGDLDDKGEDDDWIISVGNATGLQGEPVDVIEQTNILLGGVCAADLDGDGEVKVADLLILIGDWGSCSECDSDLDNDGEVKIADLLILIGAWGPCE